MKSAAIAEISRIPTKWLEGAQAKGEYNRIMHELQKRAVDPASIGVPNLIAYSNAYARYVASVRLAKHSQLIVRGYDGNGLYNPVFDKLEDARRDLADIIIKLDLLEETADIRQPDDPALSAAPFGYAADM